MLQTIATRISLVSQVLNNPFDSVPPELAGSATSLPVLACRSIELGKQTGLRCTADGAKSLPALDGAGLNSCFASQTIWGRCNRLLRCLRSQIVGLYAESYQKSNPRV
eukprot:656312-Lingulodinium_polyedra.AAC.1